MFLKIKQKSFAIQQDPALFKISKIIGFELLAESKRGWQKLV